MKNKILFLLALVPMLAFAQPLPPPTSAYGRGLIRAADAAAARAALEIVDNPAVLTDETVTTNKLHPDAYAWIKTQGGSAANTTNPATLWVDPGGSDSNPGTEAKPLLNPTTARALATNGMTIVLNPGVYDIGVSNLDLHPITNPMLDGINLIGYGAELKSRRPMCEAGGGNAVPLNQKGAVVVPGNNSTIRGLTITCTTNWDGNTHYWAGLGCYPGTDRAFTNVMVKDITIKNGASDAFFIGNMDQTTNYSITIDGFTVDGWWDGIALGGGTGSRMIFKNGLSVIHGPGGDSENQYPGCFVRNECRGAVDFVEVSAVVTNVYLAQPFIVAADTGPMTFSGGNVLVKTNGAEGAYYTWLPTVNGVNASFTICQWPPPNTVGKCVFNGKHLTFGTNLVNAKFDELNFTSSATFNQAANTAITNGASRAIGYFKATWAFDVGPASWEGGQVVVYDSSMTVSNVYPFSCADPSQSLTLGTCVSFPVNPYDIIITTDATLDSGLNQHALKLVFP